MFEASKGEKTHAGDEAGEADSGALIKDPVLRVDP